MPPDWHDEQVDERGRSVLAKLQTQGVHHITLVGADRQTPSISGRACSACRSCSSSPISTIPRPTISTSIPATAG